MKKKRLIFLIIIFFYIAVGVYFYNNLKLNFFSSIMKNKINSYEMSKKEFADEEDAKNLKAYFAGVEEHEKIFYIIFIDGLLKNRQNTIAKIILPFDGLGESEYEREIRNSYDLEYKPAVDTKYNFIDFSDAVEVIFKYDDVKANTMNLHVQDYISDNEIEKIKIKDLSFKNSTYKIPKDIYLTFLKKSDINVCRITYKAFNPKGHDFIYQTYIGGDDKNIRWQERNYFLFMIMNCGYLIAVALDILTWLIQLIITFAIVIVMVIK